MLAVGVRLRIGDNRAHLFVRGNLEEIMDGLALRRTGGHRYLIDFSLESFSAGREEDDIVVCVGREELINQVLVFEVGADKALAAALLHAEGRRWHSFHVAVLGKSDNRLFLRNKILL